MKSTSCTQWNGNLAYGMTWKEKLEAACSQRVFAFRVNSIGDATSKGIRKVPLKEAVECEARTFRISLEVP